MTHGPGELAEKRGENARSGKTSVKNDKEGDQLAPK